jgi:hypothetical protein
MLVTQTPIERIASEVIHPDDIDVRLTGMLRENVHTSFFAINPYDRYWQPGRYHIFLTRICVTLR